jgi:hypothetical protein
MLQISLAPSAVALRGAEIPLGFTLAGYVAVHTDGWLLKTSLRSVP